MTKSTRENENPINIESLTGDVSRLMWSLACNSRHPDRLETLINEFNEGRDPVEAVVGLSGALMGLTFEVLEPALKIGDQAHKSLRREFAITLKNIEAMDA